MVCFKIGHSNCSAWTSKFEVQILEFKSSFELKNEKPAAFFGKETEWLSDKLEKTFERRPFILKRGITLVTVLLVDIELRAVDKGHFLLARILAYTRLESRDCSLHVKETVKIENLIMKLNWNSVKALKA